MEKPTIQQLYDAFEQLTVREQEVLYQRLKAKVKPDENEIVAYTVTGEPLTKAEYIAHINEAIAQIERGDCYTEEEYSKIRASWNE